MTSRRIGVKGRDPGKARMAPREFTLTKTAAASSGVRAPTKTTTKTR